MSRATHFSHHVCGQYRPHDISRDSAPHTGCHSMWCAHLAGRPIGTASFDPERVTCRHCRKLLNGRLREVNHREMVERAWLACCQHRGAAWPFGAGELAAIERENCSRSIRRVWNLAHAADHFHAGQSVMLAQKAAGRTFSTEEARAAAEGMSLADCYRDIAAKIAGSYASNEPIADAMRPAIAELLLAAEWYEQIDACMARGDAIVESVLERIRSGEIGYPKNSRDPAEQAERAIS